MYIKEIKTKGSSTIKLFLGDCFAGMQKYLEKNSVDVIVTSPPYNIGVNYSKYDDKIPRDEYLNWIGNWAMITREVLKDDGSIFLNIGSKPLDLTTVSFLMIMASEKKVSLMLPLATI